ncbi:hypothetical protein PA05_1909 [Cutibacterium acnes P05]|nr:hypothetical protein [Cutibacterium acnes P05]
MFCLAHDVSLFWFEMSSAMEDLRTDTDPRPKWSRQLTLNSIRRPNVKIRSGFAIFFP